MSSDRKYVRLSARDANENCSKLESKTLIKVEVMVTVMAMKKCNDNTADTAIRD